MKLLPALMLVTISATNSLAQYAETLVSDRPGLGNSPLTVGKRVLQVQPGIQFKNVSRRDYLNKYRYEYSTNQIVRYGLFERFELSTNIAYRYVRHWKNNRHQGTIERWDTSQISKFDLSARWNILLGKGWKPSIGLLTNFEFLRGNNLVPPISPYVTLMITLSPLKDMGILINVGLTNPIHINPDLFFLFNAGYQISKRFSFFMEYYLEPPTPFFDFAMKFNTGMAFLVHDSLQLDFFVGRSAYPDTTDWFMNIGASWRINTLR